MSGEDVITAVVNRTVRVVSDGDSRCLTIGVFADGSPDNWHCEVDAWDADAVLRKVRESVTLIIIDVATGGRGPL